MCLHTKFHANRTIFGEFITFHKFSRWRPPRSRDITLCNSGPHTKSPRWSELAVQILFRNLDYFWIYRNFRILSLCMYKMPTYTPTFWWIFGALTLKFNSHYSNPQKAHPWAKTRRLSHQPWKSIRGFDLGACPRKKVNCLFYFCSTWLCGQHNAA